MLNHFSQKNLLSSSLLVLSLFLLSPETKAMKEDLFEETSLTKKKTTTIPLIFKKFYAQEYAEKDGILTITTKNDKLASYQAETNRVKVTPGETFQIPYNIKVEDGGKVAFGVLNSARNGWIGGEVPFLEPKSYTGVKEIMIPQGESEISLVLLNYHLGTAGQSTFTAKLGLEKVEVQKSIISIPEKTGNTIPLKFKKLYAQEYIEKDGTLTIITKNDNRASYQAETNRVKVTPGERFQIPYKITVEEGGKMAFGVLNSARNGWIGGEVVLTPGTYHKTHKIMIPKDESEISLVLLNYHLGTPGQSKFTAKLGLEKEEILSIQQVIQNAKNIRHSQAIDEILEKGDPKLVEVMDKNAEKLFPQGISEEDYINIIKAAYSAENATDLQNRIDALKLEGVEDLFSTVWLKIVDQKALRVAMGTIRMHERWNPHLMSKFEDLIEYEDVKFFNIQDRKNFYDKDYSFYTWENPSTKQIVSFHINESENSSSEKKEIILKKGKEHFKIKEEEIISIDKKEIIFDKNSSGQKSKIICEKKSTNFSIKESDNIESLLKFEEMLSKEGTLKGYRNPQERIDWLWKNRKDIMTEEEKKEIKEIENAQGYVKIVNRSNVIEQMKEALKKSERLVSQNKDIYFEEILPLGENEVKAIDIVKDLKDINEIEEQWFDLDSWRNKKIDEVKQNLLEIKIIRYYTEKFTQPQIREQTFSLKEEAEKLVLEIKRLQETKQLTTKSAKNLVNLGKKIKLLSAISTTEKGGKHYEENVFCLKTDRKNKIKELMKSGKILKKDMDVDIIKQSIPSSYKADLIKTLVSCPSEKITAILENLDFFRIMNKYTTSSYINSGENYYVKDHLYISDCIQMIKILSLVEAKEIKNRIKSINENKEIFFDITKNMEYSVNRKRLQELFKMPAKKIEGMAQFANNDLLWKQCAESWGEEDLKFTNLLKKYTESQN
jgi:hypothetical protein